MRGCSGSLSDAPYFLWWLTIPARSTNPLYGRLIEAYIVHASEGVLPPSLSCGSSPRSACNSSAIHCRRDAGCLTGARAAICKLLQSKGLCRVAGQRYARVCGSGVCRTPQSPLYNSYHLRQRAAPRLADKKGRLPAAHKPGKRRGDGGAARQAAPRGPGEEVRGTDFQDAATRENEGSGV